MTRFVSILFLQVFIISHLANGQAIVRSSLSSFGSTFSESGLIFRQTAGQSSGTDVLQNYNMTLRQGFQQPVDLRNLSRHSGTVDFTISPNPAKTMTRLTFHEEIQECIVAVRDLNGSSLYTFREVSVNSKWLDLNNLKPGVYIVSVVSHNATGSKKLIITK